jgi:Nitrile hydratase beta subunit, C-terminal
MDEQATFAPGDRVRIIDLDKSGHVRTPLYARGKAGTIDHCCGAFENPEERAYGRVGRARVPLYRVRLMQRDLWPEYAGAERDSLVLEIYQHWLRPA